MLLNAVEIFDCFREDSLHSLYSIVEWSIENNIDVFIAGCRRAPVTGGDEVGFADRSRGLFNELCCVDDASVERDA